MGLVRRGSATSTSQIEILWDALTTSLQTGDSPIKSYHLQWDQDGTLTSFVELAGFTSPYTLTSFILTGP